MLRKLIVVGSWMLLMQVALLGFAIAAPRWTEPFSAPIRTGFIRAVAALVSTFIDGSLDVGSLQGSILKDPTLSNITLKDADGETVVSVDELRLRYSLRGFLKGRLHIHVVEIVKPRFNLVEESDGRLNLEHVLSLEPEPTEDTPFSLTVKLDKLALHNGHISLRLPDVPGTRAIEDIILQLQGQFDPQGFRLEVQELTARTEPSDVVLKTLRGTVSQTADAIRFKDWLLQTAESTLTLSGTFPLGLFASKSNPEEPPGANPTPHREKQNQIVASDSGAQRGRTGEAGKANGSAPSPADEHSKPPPNAALQGAEPGAAAPPESTLMLALHPLDVTEIGRILGDPTLQGEVEGEITTAQIDDVLNVMGRLMAGEEGTLELDAKLNPKRRLTAYHSSLTVSELDISALVDKPGLESDLNLRLQVTGEGFEPAYRSARLQLAIDRSHLGDIVIQPSEIRLQARGERFQVHAFDLNTSIFEANLEGAIDLAGHSNLSYALSLAPADLRELIAANTLGGNIAVSGRLEGEWPEVMTSGVLAGEKLVYEDTRLETFTLAYEATDLGRQPQADARLQAQDLKFGERGIETLSAQSNYAYENGTHRLQFGAKTAGSSQLYANIEGIVTANDERQTLVISEFEARLDDHTWRAMTPLQATRSAAKTRLEPFRLAHARESIEIAGALIGDKLEDVRLRATDLDLNFVQGVFSLPPVVAGRASWQANLSGHLTSPILESTLTLRSTGEKALPLERASAIVRYENNQLETALSIIQEGRKTVRLQSTLPIELGLVAMPIERRLLDAPLQVELALEQPDLAALSRALPAMPAFSGTLGGTLTVSGSYDRLTVNSNTELQQLGIAGAASELDGPMRLAADVVTAPSFAALREAIATNALTVTVPQLTFRVPSLTGQLGGRESGTPLALRDVLAEISAKWDGNALTSASSYLQIHAQLDAFPPLAFISKTSLESEQLTVEQVTLKTPASNLSGAGEISLRDRSIQFSLNIAQLQLSEFEGIVPPELPSAVSGTVNLAGTLETPALNARLRYAEARIHAEATARLAEPHQPYRASMRISSLDVGQFGPELSGELRARVEVQGSGLTANTPEARISIDVGSAGFALAPGLAARVRARVTGSTVRVALLDVTSEPLELRARGTLSTTDPTDLRYQLVVRNLGAVEQQLGVALKANGELTGSITGEFDALRAQSKLQLENWRYGPWQGHELRASVDGKTLTTAPAVTFQAAVTDVEGPQVAPTSLTGEGRFANQSGAFSLEATEGPFRNSRVAGVLHIEPHLQIRIDPLRLQTEQWTWNNVQPIEILYDAEQVLAVRNLQLKNAASRITAWGTFAPQGALSGQVRIEDLQIKPMVSTFAPATPIPDGKLTVNLEVNGTVDQPELEGTLQVAGLQWTERPLGEVRAEITASGPAFRGNAKWTDNGDLLVSVTGRVETGKPQSIAVAVEAPGFDLAKLEAFSPEIQQSAGRLRIDLQVRGTLDQPSAEGVIELQDGRLVHAKIGEPYTDIQTRALFKGNRLNIERFEVSSSTGTARLRGWMETDGLVFSRANLTLDANEFTAVKTRALEAVVSSDVTVRGSQEALAASGSITVPRARIRYENLPATGPSEVEPWELTVEGVYGPGPEAATFGAAEATAATEAEAQPLSFLRADIQLDMPRNVWIQGKGTAIELNGQLQLKKDPGQPFVLAGDVETLRGFATFLGRKFNIEKGVVTFTGSEDLSPVLDISASYEVSDYTVYVNVTGDSKEPEISYNSEPELDQQDILSLLIFGKTSDRLTSSEQTTLGSKAEQFAGGLAAGMLEQTVGKALGLDAVAIELGDQGSASSVGAGRYLTQDIYVEYERKFRDPRQGTRTGNAVTVEYSISQGLKVEATGSDYGETAIDFVWSHDY